jgi:L,D-transpeptidase YcbB
MRFLHLSLLPLTLAALMLVGCATSDAPSPTATAVQQIVDGKPRGAREAEWPAVREFYSQRRHAPAWIDGKFPSERSGEALAVIHAAADHGFAAENYDEAGILEAHTRLNDEADKDAPDRVQRLAEFDVQVTVALMALGHDVALGRTNPSKVVSNWKSRRPPPDFAGTLSQAVDGGNVTSWLDQARPQHPEYAALQRAYADLRGQRDKGGWPKVSDGFFKRGRPHPAVVTLRQRLAASGMLTGEAASSHSAMFDDDVDAGVRGFQELHGLKATGIVDAPTLAAMNVPIEERLQQVALNLERWRWMPDDLGARHLFVNIPHFHLIAREGGRPVMDIRVVVGKPGNETPIFSDEMESVVFSPYWNIPDSIKQGETAPAVMRDPSYLERNNIEVLRGSRRVDVAAIDWNDASELRELSFRQRPGANNALGHVKFLFPNDFDVYLHDTPADSLFERRGRAFSHGCVRVEEPEALAKYILRGYEEWDETRILEAMHSGNERQVKLEETIPVHITYFTAWVDDKGGLHFQPDVYGYDVRQRQRQQR